MYFLLYNIKKKGRDQHIEQNISKPKLKKITFQKLGSNLINELDPKWISTPNKILHCGRLSTSPRDEKAHQDNIFPSKSV